MLKVVNLVKKYKPKKGKPIVALNSVNLEFQDKGLVFLLGKSGSGKSTLLNLLGGLDKYDSGDIIISGKSSKTFSQSKFDSYRNTLVGFIFQEYNILEDMTVGANIALALELQGKKAKNQTINEILSQVELDNLGDRKPNELSGGQKQRVAIARALIKNPKVIMADEPTGALDSGTGIQIFNLLKKLSKQKLVIVVSHDREFAENYADRIIELKDGEVISDVTNKSNVKNLDKVDRSKISFEDDLITIRKGYRLTEQDKDKINEFFSLHSGREMSLVSRKANLEQGDFVRTRASHIKSTNAEIDFVKSHLPLSKRIKMGFKNLLHKKIRLAFTLLLTIISLSIFAFSTMISMFDATAVGINSIMKSNQKQVELNKSIELRIASNNDSTYHRTSGLKFSSEEVDALKEKYQTDIASVYQVDRLINNMYNHSNDYYSDRLNQLLELSEDQYNTMQTFGNSTYPSEPNQMAVSKFVYEKFENYGCMAIDGGQIIPIKNYNDLIGQSLEMKGEQFEITAIIDTNFDQKPYERLKQYVLEGVNYNEKQKGEDTSNFYSEVGFHEIVFTNENNINRLFVQASGVYNLSYNSSAIKLVINNEQAEDLIENVGIFKENLYTNYYFNNNKKISNNEIMLSVDVFLDLLLSNQFEDRPISKEKIVGLIELLNAYKYDENGEIYFGFNFDKIMLEIEKYDLINYFNSKNNKMEVFLDEYSKMPAKAKSIKLIGLVQDKNFKGVVVTEDILNSIKLYSDCYIDKLFLTIPKDPIYVEKLLNDAMIERQYNVAHTKYDLSILNSYKVVVSTQNSIEMPAIITTIIFIIFSMILFYSFIQASILFKKNEIGILRAIGAKSADVVGIFSTESIIISSICSVVACLVMLPLSTTMNDLLLGNILDIAMFNFSLINIIAIVIVSFLIALISTFIPVMREAIKRPIDTIKDR